MFLFSLLQATEQQLLVLRERAAPQDLTDLLWGLAKLKLEPQWQRLPGNGSRGPHFSHSSAVAAVNQQAAATAAAAISCMQQQLGQQQQQQQHGAAGGWNAGQLSLSLWAVAKLRCPVSSTFWQQYIPAVQQHLAHSSARDLSNIIWALANLQYHPGADWMNLYLAAVQQLLCDYSSKISGAGSSSAGGGSSAADISGQSVAVILLNLAQLGEVPPASWIASVLLILQQQQQQQQHRQQQQQQQQQQHRQQQQQHRQQQQQRRGLSLLQQLDGYSLASVLGALAKWQYVPDLAWLLQCQQAVQQQLHRCGGHDVAQISWALARLAISPSPAGKAAEHAAAATLVTSQPAGAWLRPASLATCQCWQQQQQRQWQLGQPATCQQQ
jgi:hypothetical protein